MIMTDAQFKRLPRYAQYEIEILQMRLDEAHKKIAERNTTSNKEPHVLLDPYAGMLSEIRPLKTHVSFRPEGERPNYFFNVRMTEEDELEVYCDTLLVIKPTSGNIATIARRENSNDQVPQDPEHLQARPGDQLQDLPRR
jgi:hypothetical protein